MSELIIETWTRSDMKRVKRVKRNILNADVKYVGLCGGLLCAHADDAVYVFEKCYNKINTGGRIIEVDKRIYTLCKALNAK